MGCAGSIPADLGLPRSRSAVDTTTDTEPSEGDSAPTVATDSATSSTAARAAMLLSRQEDPLPVSSPRTATQEVIITDTKEFLSLLRMNEYWPAFEQAGYTKLIGLGALQELELRGVGITKAGHIKKLLKNIGRLERDPDASSFRLAYSPRVSPIASAANMDGAAITPIILSAVAEEDAGDTVDPPSAPLADFRRPPGQQNYDFSPENSPLTGGLSPQHQHEPSPLVLCGSEKSSPRPRIRSARDSFQSLPTATPEMEQMLTELEVL